MRTRAQTQMNGRGSCWGKDQSLAERGDEWGSDTAQCTSKVQLGPPGLKLQASDRFSAMVLALSTQVMLRLERNY